MRDVWIGFFVNGLFAAFAYGAKSVTVSGAVGGVFLGTWIYGFLGWRGFAIVAGFFILASLFTRFGFGIKRKKGIAQKKEGRRTHREAFANGLVGAVCATLSFFTGNFMYTLGFVASFATALADTTATELGPLYGRSAFLPPTFKKAVPGTPGAVSLEGSLFGILGGLFLGLFAFWLTLIQKQDILSVTVSAGVGSLAESFLGSRPFSVGHDLRNFLNTLVGAGVAMFLFWVF